MHADGLCVCVCVCVSERYGERISTLEIGGVRRREKSEREREREKREDVPRHAGTSSPGREEERGDAVHGWPVRVCQRDTERGRNRLEKRERERKRGALTG